MALQLLTALPRRVYPAFLEFASQIVLGDPARSRFNPDGYRGGKPLKTVMAAEARERKVFMNRHLIKRCDDGQFELTRIGIALKLSLAGQYGEYDQAKFLSLLPSDIIASWLSLPAKSREKRWWMDTFVDLGLCRIRMRTDSIDINMDTETVLEWLLQSQNTPQPSEIITPTGARAPDAERINIFRHACADYWRIPMPLEDQEPEPIYTDEDWDIL